MLILVVDSSIEGGLFMSKKNTYDQKHLSTSQRIHIEKGLNDGLSFAAIARKLNKHPSTIAKEVKKYRTFQPRENDPDDYVAIRLNNGESVTITIFQRLHPALSL